MFDGFNGFTPALLESLKGLFPVDNLHNFLKDEQIRPYSREERHDIAAADAPRRSNNEFRIWNCKPPKNQVVVIKSIAPYVMQRVNIGDATTESFQMIPALNTMGFFLVEPVVQNQVPFIIEADINKPKIMANASDADRYKGPGFTCLSDNPISSILTEKDHPYSILVRGDQPCEIFLKVLPASLTNGIPNPFFVGNPPAGLLAGQNRVDFAGALVYGVTMPEALYDTIDKRWQALR